MFKSVSQSGSKITSCCHDMQPIGKELVTAMNWQQEPIGKKLALEFFIKNIYATPLVFISSFFIHFLCPTTTSAVSPQKVSFNLSSFN